MGSEAKQLQWLPAVEGAAEPSGKLMGVCIITTRMVAPCDSCGRSASPVHMPRQQHGLYCARCCPVCSKSETGRSGAKERKDE